MPDKAADRPIEQWDRYWAFGSLHSFSQVAGGNYEGAIADFWRERFATLPDGARVLDVATGNGAVALLALEAADRAGREFEIHGCDLADIDPAHRVGDPALRRALSRIRFHPRTPAESLPFDDGRVDLVCSQYGIEYSDVPATIAEIDRVAAPGGAVALVLHHRESVLLEATALELEQLSFVLDEARVWVHARNLLRTMSETGGRNRTKVQRKQLALDRAVQQVRDAARASANPRMLLGPLNYIHEILNAAGREPWKRLLELLEESRQRLLANRRRLVDMQHAACGEAEMERIAEAFRQRGYALERNGPLREHDHSLLGWQLAARRA